MTHASSTKPRAIEGKNFLDRLVRNLGYGCAALAFSFFTVLMLAFIPQAFGKPPLIAVLAASITFGSGLYTVINSAVELVKRK